MRSIFLSPYTYYPVMLFPLLTEMVLRWYQHLCFWARSFKKSRQLACCINHAHIHIFPSNTDIYSAVVNQIPSHNEEFPDLEKCYEWIRKKQIGSYLLFGNMTLSRYCVVDTSIDVYPSQYLRQLTYRLLVPDQTRRGWDWRQYPYYQNMLDTITMFRENGRRCWFRTIVWYFMTLGWLRLARTATNSRSSNTLRWWFLWW